MSGGIATRGQLRMSFVRWAAVCVPLVLLLGFVSGRSVPAGDQNSWYVALDKPALTPPGWVFPVAWSLLYVMLGAVLALILSARGARGRGAALALFAGQLALNLAWTPIFFGAHRVGLALAVIVLIGLLSVAATLLIARIRPLAAWLMVPYMMWIGFAAALTWEIDRLNPDSRSLVPSAASSQMID